ncbi:MAG: right-handed parallel beta-helix repeat-containing protein, partial [Anaerolineales bacterium]|nr:right-handed parallel beta-helix repeat-containing protein [Anaerolineales bacterium]
GADTDCAGSPSNGDDTITFSVSGTITLGSTLPTIVSGQGALTIDGTGQNVTISGKNSVQVMVVNAGANLTLRNLTIANGNAGSGSGIWNNGTLTVTNSTFSGNSATAWGGGILNKGTLMVTSSTFSENSASFGGSIYNDGGTLTVTNSTFSGNGAGFGGGIYNARSGTLTVTGSTFSDNRGRSGGGIYNASTLTVTSSTFSKNIVLSGGGIMNFGTLTVTNSTFSENVADGGGIFNTDIGTLVVLNSTFKANFFRKNGGGIWNMGRLDVVNSTFFRNEPVDYHFPNSLGGGIFNDHNGTLTVTNNTFSENRANVGGGIYIVDGSKATLWNTIVANSTSGGDCVGTLHSAKNNLIKNRHIACDLKDGMNGNIIGQDPNLGSLTGSPAYFPLNPGSPAMDAGDNATCAAPPVNNQSQNGVTRPQDGDLNGTAVCDIGVYEAIFPFPNLQATKTNNVGGAVVLGMPFTWTVTVKNSGTAGATFNSGQVILRDYLPAGASYGTPVVQNPVGVTNGGNIACAIAGNVLSCTANAATVTLAAESGRFDVTFSVTPTAVGTLANPTGGVCRADPDALIGESNENDNDCANTVTVTARVYLPLVRR